MTTNMDQTTDSTRDIAEKTDEPPVKTVSTSDERLAEYRINPVQYVFAAVLGLLLIPLIGKSGVAWLLLGLLVIRFVTALSFRAVLYPDRLQFGASNAGSIMLDDVDYMEFPDAHNYFRIHFKDDRKPVTVWSIILKLEDRNDLRDRLTEMGVDVRRK